MVLFNELNIESILEFLPLQEKVRFERINKRWAQVVAEKLLKQNAIGTHQTFCDQKDHQVTLLDIIPTDGRLYDEPKQDLVYQAMVSLLKRCPNLKALSMVTTDDEENDGMSDDGSGDRMAFGFRSGRIKTKASVKASYRLSFANPFLAVAESCRQLECLDVQFMCSMWLDSYGPGINAIWLQLARKCGKTLKHIRIPNLTDETMKEFVKKSPNLETVIAEEADFGGECYSAFRPPLKMLVLMNQPYAEQTCDDPWRFLARSKAKATLEHMTNMEVDGKMLICITKHFSNLKSLKLGFWDCYDDIEVKDLKGIKKLTKLEDLTLDGSRKGFGTPVDKPLVEIFASCSLLKNLVLEDLPVTDESLKTLACNQMEAIRLSGSGSGLKAVITDLSLDAFSRLPNLKVLNVDYANEFTSEALHKFLETRNKMTFLNILKCKHSLASGHVYEFFVNMAKKCHPKKVRAHFKNPEDSFVFPSNEAEEAPDNLFLEMTVGETRFSLKNSKLNRIKVDPKDEEEGFPSDDDD